MQIAIPFFSILLGALITWFFSYRYYVKGGKELKVEANKLREERKEINRLTNIIVRGLSNAKILDVNYSDEGKILGLNFKIITKIEVKSNTSNADLEIDSKPNSKTGQ